MSLHLTHEVLRLTFVDPFRISRSDDAHGATTIVVELRDDRYPGLVGLGEGYVGAYYGETTGTMIAAFPTLLEAVGEPELTGDGLERAAAAMDAVLRWNGGAKCAIDIALHDLAGKVLGLPVHALLGLGADIPPTDFTLGIDEPDRVAERARRAARFPALKIKLGGPADVATLEAVRSVFDGSIRVDANNGWTPSIAQALLPDMVRLGVELIEQPFPPRRYDWLRELQASTDLPIVADESAVTIEDLDALVGVVKGVNVKLGKCGGVGPAKRMLERAKSMGFQTFLGCMEETSIAIAASAAVASLADWVDLDGNLLIADDPFEGLRLDESCRWQLGQEPGLGIRRRTQSARP